jgi:hypothetical protein
MTTILRFQSADLLQCRFAVSPLGEVTDALRFLARAARHATPGADGYHLPWQRQVRPLLAGLGIGPLLAVMGIDGYQPDFLNPVPDSPFAEIGTELDRVRAAPPNRVAAEMARALDPPGVPGPGHNAHRRPGPARALADYPWLADDPARARDTLAGMLQVAWTALVEPWWPRLRDVLDADITYRMTDLRRHIRGRAWSLACLKAVRTVGEIILHQPNRDTLVARLVWNIDTHRAPQPRMQAPRPRIGQESMRTDPAR